VSLARLDSTVIAGTAVVVVAVIKAGGDQVALVERVAVPETGEDEIDLILAVTVG
jgi:hypothetical protein